MGERGLGSGGRLRYPARVLSSRAATPRSSTASGVARDRRRVGAALALCVLAAIGCGTKKSSGGSSTPPPGGAEMPPVLRDAGVPTGDPSGASIGPNGGTLSSGDGGVTIIVPPGAVTSPTSFSIQPITSTALGGVEGAYRIRPDGGTLAAPVTVVLRGPERYAAGTSIQGLGIAYQDATGFWFPAKNVVRDASANTLSVTTTHFSDWGVVWAAGVPGLYGSFTLSQTIGIPLDATGTATLFYQGSNDTKTLYVVTGTVAVPATIPHGTSTCTPTAPSTTVAATVAELWSAPSQLRWSINGQWELACVNAFGPSTTEFAAAMFDTLGINLIGCARSYVGTPILTPERLQGTYAIDCGAQGKVTATWDFLACVPGVVCQGTDPCHTSVISCDTGAPVCTPTATPAANGTTCGVDQVCSGGTCVPCAAGSACTSSNACHTAAITCDTGAPICTDTGDVADGTACGVDQVCSAGACTTCVAGGTCTSSNPCHTATLSCSTGAQVCTDTGNQPDGTSCGTGLSCTAGECLCAAGAACTSANPCHTAAYTCDPTTGAPVCTDTGNVANGTSCGSNLVCNEGACEPCTAGAACTSTTDPLCKTAAITCDTGLPVCTDSGDVADGTACGTGLACSAGVCACAAGTSCVSQNPCMDAAIACDPTTGAPICTDTIAKPDGTVCGTDLVCSGGACVGCVVGNGCTPETNVCELGTISSCAAGPTCTGTGVFQPPGTSCGTNQVCSSAGACVPCATGAACDTGNVCHSGSVSCTSGTPVCVDGGPVADGTTCGTNQVCSGGTCVECAVGNTCSTGNVCELGSISSCATGPVCTVSGLQPDGTVCGTFLECQGGVCSCVAGTACPPSDACHTGAVACDPINGASCVQTALDPGTACGSGLVCDVTGACVACSTGAACDPGIACHAGTTSCTTGSPVCTDAGLLPPGTSCGDGQVCDSVGACGACAAGTACTSTTDAACKTAAITCDTGVPVCTDTGNVLDGTACGAGLACSGGACVCAAGTACTSTTDAVCKIAAINCDTGAPVCTDTADAVDGTSCTTAGGGAGTCQAGVCTP